MPEKAKRFPLLFFHLLFLGLIVFYAFYPLYVQISYTPQDRFYTWMHGRYSDYYSYLSLIRQGATQFHQTNQFTTDITNPQYTHVFYLLIGRIGSFFHLNPIVIYHLTMVGCLLLFYFFTWRLISILLSGWFRILAMIFIFLTSPVPTVGGYSLFDIPLNISSLWWTKSDIYQRLTLIPHHFFRLGFRNCDQFPES